MPLKKDDDIANMLAAAHPLFSQDGEAIFFFFFFFSWFHRIYHLLSEAQRRPLLTRKSNLCTFSWFLVLLQVTSMLFREDLIACLTIPHTKLIQRINIWQCLSLSFFLVSFIHTTICTVVVDVLQYMNIYREINRPAHWLLNGARLTKSSWIWMGNCLHVELLLVWCKA